jgi:hypothetical protein
MLLAAALIPAVVAVVLLARVRGWTVFRAAMILAVGVITVRVLAEELRAPAADPLRLMYSQGGLLLITAAFFLVFTLPAELILRGDRGTRSLAGAWVAAACALLCIGFLYIALFIDRALWDTFGVCVFPGNLIPGPPRVCSFDKRHVALPPALLLLVLAYGALFLRRRAR